MEYYTLLQLEREPFSNSPDPHYFFQSRQHLGCLQKLELALRLKRGLNVVIGDVGTGKTTLCRELIRKFAQESDVDTHLILDPAFNTPQEFLKILLQMMCAQRSDSDLSDIEIKEAIKKHLFHQGIDQNRTVVVIIDEGQKISPACVEILRELLNYETNTFKLLQIVIFAQREIETILQTHANFADRINLLTYLGPMNFSDTRRMIQHRLKLASSGPKPVTLFTFAAQWAIYRASQGYPRRIVHLCHQSVLAMIIQNRSQAGWALIRSCKNRMTPPGRHTRRTLIAGFLAIVTAVILVAFTLYYRSHIQTEEASTTHYKIPQTALPSPVIPSVVAPAGEDPPAQQTIEPAAVIKTGESARLSLPTWSPPAASPSEPSISPPMVTDAAKPEQPQPHLAEHSFWASAATKQPPTALGQLVVRPGDTLGDMVRKVYGSFDYRHLQSVIEANPHISDPHSIQLGDAIFFPALEFNINTTAASCRWIILDEHKNLITALQQSDAIMKQDQIPTRPFATWSPLEGLRFQLLVQGYFATEQDAAAYLAALPAETAARARIIADWPQQTQLLSDPYGGGIQHASPTTRPGQ